MARTSTTWAKGQKPPVHRRKDAKNKKTELKEQLGLIEWQGLETFCKTNGATRLIEELQQLKGKDYVVAMQSLLEFVVPKKARVQVVGDRDNPVENKLVVEVIHTGVPFARSEDEIQM